MVSVRGRMCTHPPFRWISPCVIDEFLVKSVSLERNALWFQGIEIETWSALVFLLYAILSSVSRRESYRQLLLGIRGMHHQILQRALAECIARKCF